MFPDTVPKKRGRRAFTDEEKSEAYERKKKRQRNKRINEAEGRVAAGIAAAKDIAFAHETAVFEKENGQAPLPYPTYEVPVDPPIELVWEPVCDPPHWSGTCSTILGGNESKCHLLAFPTAVIRCLAASHE